MRWRGGIKGGQARAGRFSISGVACSIWKRNEASITSVGKIAAMPIQEKSRSACAEGLAWLVLDVACP